MICELCDGGDSSVSRCSNCRVFMCQFCVTAHERISTFKGHQILSLAEVQKLGSKALVKPAFCAKHTGETLKLFCETCQKTICRDCTIVDHREHEYEFVVDVAERERKIVQAVLQETKAKDGTVEEGVKAVQTMESLVETKIAEVSKEVDVFFDEQMKALQYLRANLQHEVRTQGQVKLKELGCQKEMLALSLAQLRSSVDFAERALEDGDDMELLSMKQQLVQRLAQLNASQFQCRPCKSDYLKVQVDKTIWDIGKMATLLYTPVDTTKCVLSMVGGEEGVLYETLAGQPVEFILVIEDEAVISKPETGWTVHAAVNNSRNNNLSQELPVHDSGNSSYLFSYRPETDGLCTLSVTVEGENVYGSPFTWKVKPNVKGKDHLSLMTSSLEEDENRKGKYCWKLKFWRPGEICYKKGKKYEIGVRCMEQADGVVFYFDTEIKRCTWCCQIGGGYTFTRSDNSHASISNLEHGDIFSVYLNFDTRKLVIYNHRSKQVELFTDVEGEIVQPIISPYVTLRGPQLQTQTGLTLDIG